MQENDEKLKELGKRIKSLRQNKKLTVSALCYPNGIEPSTLGRIEQGLVEPKYLTLLKIADALGMHIKDLLDY